MGVIRSSHETSSAHIVDPARSGWDCGSHLLSCASKPGSSLAASRVVSRIRPECRPKPSSSGRMILPAARSLEHGDAVATITS